MSTEHSKFSKETHQALNGTKIDFIKEYPAAYGGGIYYGVAFANGHITTMNERGREEVPGKESDYELVPIPREPLRAEDWETRDGRAVLWLVEMPESLQKTYPIAGFIEGVGGNDPLTWSKDGRYNVNGDTRLDLVRKAKP
jgi:hypothetical protein